MADSQWWYALGSDSHGPLYESELVNKLRAGELPLSTMVWQPGMAAWQPGSQVAALVRQLPPIPPGTSQVQELPPPPLPASPPIGFAPKSTAKPWHRWFARVWLDYLLTAVVVVILLAVFAPESPVLESDYLLAFIAAIVWIPIEAVFLSSIGTTPGKFFLGISVTCTDGGMLTFQQALSRAFSVWAIGCALMIPLVNIFTFLAQYNRVKAGKDATWDERGSFVVGQVVLSTGRKLLLTGTIAAVVALFLYGISGAA